MSTGQIDLEAFAVFTSKWTLPIAYALRGRVVRFGVLRAEQPDISQKMLSSCLKLLERQGLVERRHYPVIPPRVEYNLTREGEELVDGLAPLATLVAGARSRAGADARRFDEHPARSGSCLAENSFSAGEPLVAHPMR